MRNTGLLRTSIAAVSQIIYPIYERASKNKALSNVTTSTLR